MPGPDLALCGTEHESIISDTQSRSSLQSQFSIISNNLQNVAKQFSHRQDVYATTVAYPLPNFPGRTEEALLQQILRTRLEPGVEDWIEGGQAVAQDVLNVDSAGKPNEVLQELWEWAPVAASEEAHQQNWGGDYTRVEVEAGVETVVTGLRRKLVVPEDTRSEDDDDEDDEEQAVESDEGEDVEMVGIRRKSTAAGMEFDISRTTIQPQQNLAPLPLDSVFRFMMTGRPPQGIAGG